ncbi:MAG: CPBP family intramembrane metalloprotease [Sphingobacteriales bacterium]|nr:MAG: CPBP family intramembrane metalloprotease [Sphingobacteriales bacterium]
MTNFIDRLKSNLHIKVGIFAVYILSAWLIAKNGGNPYALLFSVPTFFIILVWPSSTKSTAKKICVEYKYVAVIAPLILVGFYILKIIYSDFFNLVSPQENYRSRFFPELVLYSGIVAPLIEEFIFRYLIFKWLRRTHPVIPLLLSSVLFGATHNFSLNSIFFGLILGVLFIRFDSIWPSTIFHVSNNLSAIVFNEHLLRILEEKEILQNLLVLLPNMIFWNFLLYIVFVLFLKLRSCLSSRLVEQRHRL